MGGSASPHWNQHDCPDVLLRRARKLKTDHPRLEISLKAGKSAETLEMLRTDALDLGLCAFPVEDPEVEVTAFQG